MPAHDSPTTSRQGTTKQPDQAIPIAVLAGWLQSSHSAPASLIKNTQKHPYFFISRPRWTPGHLGWYDCRNRFGVTARRAVARRGDGAQVPQEAGYGCPAPRWTVPVQPLFHGARESGGPIARIHDHLMVEVGGRHTPDSLAAVVGMSPGIWPDISCGQPGSHGPSSSSAPALMRLA